MSFQKLLELNVNGKIEKKKTEGGKTELSYLSWSFAWAEFVKVYPDAVYEVVKNPQGMPYFGDDSGAVCYVRVTAGGITHEMWLPVMNGNNKAMKTYQYTYTTKFGEKTVEPYTMFDVNKTIMRCLVKCLAMFGLGLYIYAGEDLPEESLETRTEKAKTASAYNSASDRVRTLLAECQEIGLNIQEVRNELQSMAQAKTLTIEYLNGVENDLISRLRDHNESI